MSKYLSAPTIAAALFLLFSASAMARGYDVGPLRIDHAWSRPAPPGAPTAVGYLTIANIGDAPDRLIGAASPAAEKVEIHRMSMTGGIMSMRPVAGGAPVPAGGSLEFAPGGYHLMFVGLKRPFKLGDHIPAILTFDHAGTVRVEFVVEQPSATAAPKPSMKMPAGGMGM